MLSTRTLFCIVIAGLISFSLLGTPAIAQAIRQEKKMSENTASESPIACNLNALDRKQRLRHESLTAQLRSATQETRELTDGYSFRLPSDEATIQKTAEWITMERRCCPFIAFGIEVGRDGGPLWLSLTGREGVKAFLKTEFSVK